MAANVNEVLGIGARPVVEVMPPGSEKSVRLRYPTFSEWYRITAEHRKCGAGNDPPPDLIARTIAACMARDDGSRMFTDDEATAFMDADPKVVLWLYVKCFETVMRSDEESVAEVEKN